MTNYSLEKEYEPFVGKLCTVLTSPVNKLFSCTDAGDLQHAQYFSGRVDRVTPLGIWLKHPNAGTDSFFPFPLVGIVEEQAVDKDDPRAAKLREELDARKKKAEEAKRPAPPPVSPCQQAHGSSFMSLSELKRLTNKK